MSPFGKECESFFRPIHGRRWKTACAEALEIGRATLYRYISGENEAPDEVVQGLRRMAAPVSVQVFPDETMARMMAAALLCVRRELDDKGWLRPPYPSNLQRFLDLSAARNVTDGKDAWPSDLGTMIGRARMMLGDWMPNVPSWDSKGMYMDEPLLDGENPTPTCRELAGGADRKAADIELVEAAGYEEFVQSCSSVRDGSIAYSTWRRYVIENPVITGRLADELVRCPDLCAIPDVEQAFARFYEAVPSSYSVDGRVALCSVSNTLLRRGEGVSFVTESRDPEAVRKARNGECIYIPWTASLRALRRPFLMFWCLPGQAEVSLMDGLRDLGWQVVGWPELDRVDLSATSPDGARRLAMDVKDYVSPTLLAARFDGFKSYERSHECYLVVPDSRISSDPTYETSFANARAALGRPQVALRSVSSMLRGAGRFA